MAPASESGPRPPSTEMDELKTFDMGSLRSHLPQKRRGLSRYFSGKSQSFTCVTDAKCVEDLKKPDLPDAKKRKKYPERQMGLHHLPPTSSWRRSLSSHQCAS
ncbi:hypothetical protein H6P81_004683 [Aristolochia fimbriata]|uniref:Uncharacterized protein n=1 Tax=Aristolochia fimbriata TaxID=158543 RepID=A0AAV7ETS3_ARIFI|nr:hypothetical protein H6P81_004683 [Aristolochia fimbriata]